MPPVWITAIILLLGILACLVAMFKILYRPGPQQYKPLQPTPQRPTVVDSTISAAKSPVAAPVASAKAAVQQAAAAIPGAAIPKIQAGPPGGLQHVSPPRVAQPAAALKAAAASVSGAIASAANIPAKIPAGNGSSDNGHGNRTWENRRLFSDFGGILKDDANLLPRIDSEDTPLADASDYMFGSATPTLASMMPETESRRQILRTDLRAAGYHQPHALQNLTAIRYVLMMGSILLAGALALIAMLVDTPGARTVLPWLVFGGLIMVPIMMWALPGMLIKSQAARRKIDIENGIPDMLDMLNMCVSQGMSVPDSINRVGRDLAPAYPALGEELAIVTEQARLGDLRTGLANFAERIDVPEVHSFTSLLMQSDRLGTSISDSLNEYSDTMRESLRQRADTKANSATFKLLFPTVLCLMPAVFLFLLGPSIVELSSFVTGENRGLLDARGNAVRQLNLRQDQLRSQYGVESFYQNP